MPVPKQRKPNAHLRTARKQRGWSQKELAELVGTTPLSIVRWESGVAFPSPYFRQTLSKVFGMEMKELGLIEEEALLVSVPGATFPTIWMLPHARNPFFTGRDDLLSHLSTHLHAGQTMALSQPQAISGLGGIGKTQLALEYAYRSTQDYQAVLWARAESQETLISSYVTFAIHLGLPEREEQEQAVIVEAVKRWLSTHRAWLLILDNADDLALLPEFLPPALGGHVLITTRAAATGRLARRTQIEELSPELGALFLLRRSGLLPPDAELPHASSEEQAQAVQIAEELGGLPLALDQAGAYLEETACGLAGYQRLYQEQRATLLQRRGGVVADHPLPVATTWSVSFQRIAAQSPAAADLLRLLVWLPADAVAEEILSAGAALLGPVLAPVAGSTIFLDQALEALRASSLVQRDPKARTLSMHRLVQAVLQDQQAPADRQTWAERAVLAVNAAFPHAEYATWPLCERLLSQALVTVEYIERYQLIREEATRLLFETASYLHDRARYGEAEPLYRRALAFREQQVGLEHPLVAEPLNNLATLYRDQGRYAEAEPLYQRALHIREQQVGPEHSEVAYPLNGLANLYGRQGKYEKAEPLYLRALAIWEHHLGPDHPQVGSPLSGLANLSYEQGKYAEAEPLYQRVLAIWEQQLGPEHPQVATSLNNLAELYRKQDKYTEAEPLYLRALAIFEQRLGPGHPYVAYPLNGLATLYQEQGKFAEAEPLYQRALSIREQQSGHPDTAETLHDLATFREQQGNSQEALALYQRALAIREQALGPDHPKTRATRERLTALGERFSQKAGVPSEENISLE